MDAGADFVFDSISDIKIDDLTSAFRTPDSRRNVTRPQNPVCSTFILFI